MKLGIREIYEAARAAGFTPDQATTWTAIALAESGGETGAHNPRGEDSRGLWQINVAPGVRENVWGDLSDPVVNARAAYDISRQGTDMRPWTTTHASHAGTSTDYRTYLDDVSAVTGYAGDPRGVEGYGSPLPEPLPPSGPTSTTTTSYDAIDLGMQPGSNLDTDQDGLTDAFERMTGSSPDVADTDQDRLSDAYEAGVSHTSAILADTDSDTLSDSAEAALGTSPTTFDTDQDGPSDGVEVEYGYDPLHAQGGVRPELATTAPPVPGATGMPGTTALAATALPGAAPMGAPAMQSATTAGATSNSRADAFVEAALAQRGDSYVFGAEAGLDDADPDVFDCSELTQWAADQVGVTIPDGAMYQYLDLKGKGQLTSVEEALNTKGALLFYFSSEPTANGGRPSQAHVAISLGDGRTIEARGSSYGVDEFGGEGRFNYAGIIPGMGEAADPLMTSADASYDQIDSGAAVDQMGDTDRDGLSDVFEQTYGFDPLTADSDRDGRADGLELLQGTNPRAADGAGVATAATLNGLDPAADEDSDSLSNAFEVERGLDPRLADTDQDGLGDAAELALGTNPLTVDSDLDGFTDRAELEFGTDPLGAPPPEPALSDLDPTDGDADVV
jgi:cell wall-associated NlpC family hydrolase